MDQNQNSPAARMKETAELIAEQISSQLTGMTGVMLKPMLENYLGLLTVSLTEVSVLEICGDVRNMLDYVEYGDGVSRNDRLRQKCFARSIECDNCGHSKSRGFDGCTGCGVQEEIDSTSEKPSFGGRIASGSGNIINYV